MNKRFIIVVMTFVALALISCNREGPTPDNPTPDNPTNSNFESYEEIEAYCLENGWSECSLHIANYYDEIYDPYAQFALVYLTDGTLGNNFNFCYQYKLCSSFSTLLSIDTPPIDGYINNFTCDNEKFGVCKRVQDLNHTTGLGYSKFYIRRINNATIKILYKRCPW